MASGKKPVEEATRARARGACTEQAVGTIELVPARRIGSQDGVKLAYAVKEATVVSVGEGVALEMFRRFAGRRVRITLEEVEP